MMFGRRKSSGRNEVLARIREKGKGAGASVISYPKSGRTWLRILLGKYLCEVHGISDDRALAKGRLFEECGLPVTRFHHDSGGAGSALPYQELNPDKSQYKDQEVVFLTRDVRDTLVSSYFQATKRKGSFHGSISEFVRHDSFGARKLLTFLAQWYNSRDVPRAFLHVRYEDLHRDAAGTTADTLAFLGVNSVDDGALAKAVEFASFGSLKKMEEKGKFGAYSMSPGDRKDPESYKVRKGKVGGYREYLSGEDIRYVEEIMEEFGMPFSEVQPPA